MPPFQPKEVVWIKLEDHYWPGIVRRPCQNSNPPAYEVSFIDDNEIEEDRAVLEQEMLLPFHEYTPKQQIATLSLIEAYQTALRHNNSIQANKDNFDCTSNQWKFKHLKRFLNELFMMTPISNQRVAQAVSQVSKFDVKPEYAVIYVREAICSTINFIVNERKLNLELKRVLENLKTQITGVVRQQLIERVCLFPK